MIPLMVRHLIYPAQEFLLRRPTFRSLRELQRTQWASPEEIDALQISKLAALLRHAEAHLPFYWRRFRESGVDLTRDEPLEALRKLPLLTKAQIRESIDQMLWRDAPGGLHCRSTGGSTGEPLTFYFDRRRQAYDQAARIRSHRWFGVDTGDRELYLWGSPIELDRTDRVRRLRDGLFNHRLLDAFNMSPSRMDDYLSDLQSYRPRCLFGYPSSIALLIDHARATGHTQISRGLRAVFVTGEVCYPHHRRTIEDFFGVPVADCYGSREAGFIAHQCPLGEMHITAENVLVEIIEDGRPVAPGAAGEIVVTHLDAYGMPFIRYRTGDQGRLKTGRCACGRGLPMMGAVEGRATDFLYLPDGTVKHALSVIYPLREMAGVGQFRVTQNSDYGVKVKVVRTAKATGVTADAVAGKVRTVLGDKDAVHVDLVDRIAPAGSGKYRYVISHARPTDAGTQAEAVHE